MISVENTIFKQDLMETKKRKRCTSFTSLSSASHDSLSQLDFCSKINGDKNNSPKITDFASKHDTFDIESFLENFEYPTSEPSIHRQFMSRNGSFTNVSLTVAGVRISSTIDPVVEHRLNLEVNNKRYSNWKRMKDFENLYLASVNYMKGDGSKELALTNHNNFGVRFDPDGAVTSAWEKMRSALGNRLKEGEKDSKEKRDLLRESKVLTKFLSVLLLELPNVNMLEGFVNYNE